MVKDGKKSKSSYSNETRGYRVGGRMTMEERTFIPEITVEEVGEAKVGLRSDEVVIGLAPAFLKYQNKTIVDVPHMKLYLKL